ncbi:MAG TPA: hypothetical protein VLX92_17755 [Kofleriaceae bacterium]|nr:hypothetical protein [Kofleriaceae bacterium]
MDSALLELCDRVRRNYQAAYEDDLLSIVAALVDATPLRAEWQDALARRGELASWLVGIDEPETWTGAPLRELLEASPFPTLHKIGFWRSHDEPWWPMPSSGELDRGTAKRVAAYLRRGYPSTRYLGFSWCRVCKRDDGEMGDSDVTDGVHLWPEGLVHYVVEHRVALPPAFVALCVDGPRWSDERCRLLDALDGHGVITLDGTAWCRWAGMPLPRRPHGVRGWFVEGPVGGRRGPYDDDELRARIRAGEVQRYHRLWKLGIGRERKACDVPGFGELCPPPRPL